MKTLLIVGLACFVLPSACSQFDPPGLSAKSRAYHTKLLAEIEPKYHLQKIKVLIAKIKDVTNEGDGGTSALPNKQFRSLSSREKFTYCMIHGEVFSQNCDGMPATLNEENLIFAHPASAFGNEGDWSERQTKFLHSHRKEVIGWLRGTILASGRVAINVKKAILELDTSELIPEVLSVFKKSKDKDLDILSVCSVLMQEGNYKPYRQSLVFRKLYKAPDASYKSTIPDNAANENVIIDAALAYANQRKR